MNKICLLKNPIQDYARGSHTAIPELLGEPPPLVLMTSLWGPATSTIIQSKRWLILVFLSA
jgi:hypothetical protein